MRGLLLSILLPAAMALLAACQFDPFYNGPPQPMKSTGAPCGFRAVDAGICPKVGYRVPPGEHY